MSDKKKSVILLEIYNSLRAGEHLNRHDVLAEYHISSQTFYRYLTDIKEYLERYHQSYHLESDKVKGIYLSKVRQR